MPCRVRVPTRAWLNIVSECFRRSERVAARTEPDRRRKPSWRPRFVCRHLPVERFDRHPRPTCARRSRCGGSSPGHRMTCKRNGPLGRGTIGPPSCLLPVGLGRAGAKPGSIDPGDSGASERLLASSIAAAGESSPRIRSATIFSDSSPETHLSCGRTSLSVGNLSAGSGPLHLPTRRAQPGRRCERRRGHIRAAAGAR